MFETEQETREAIASYFGEPDEQIFTQLGLACCQSAEDELGRRAKTTEADDWAGSLDYWRELAERHASNGRLVEIAHQRIAVIEGLIAESGRR